MKLFPDSLKWEDFVFFEELSSPDVISIEVVFHNIIDNWVPFFTHQCIKLGQERNQSIQGNFIKLEEVSIIFQCFEVVFEMEGFQLLQE